MGCCSSKGGARVVNSEAVEHDVQRQVHTRPGDSGLASRAASEAGSEYDPLQSNSAVKVAVVVRPLLDNEKKKRAQDTLVVQPPALVKLPARAPEGSQVTGQAYAFEFDRVYRMLGKAVGQQLQAEVMQPLLLRFLQGFNATVLAYGQTGSGKTYTMGTAATAQEVARDVQPAGVIPWAVRFLFEQLQHITQYATTVKVTYVEVHQDDIRDLLAGSPEAPLLALRESPAHGTYVDGAREVEVRSAAEVAALLEEGNARRATAVHNLNDQSSRSHAVFTLCLEQRRRATAAVAPATKYNFLQSKLHLVDLAGSERSKETGATGQQFAEGVNINKGLSALGNVISALTEGKGRKHIPYRDSKLTRILQNALGGNSETVMIACVSPADCNQEQSLSTLRYASRARSIKNRVKINDVCTSKEEISYLRRVIASKDAELAQLKAELDACRGQQLIPAIGKVAKY